MSTFDRNWTGPLTAEICSPRGRQVVDIANIWRFQRRLNNGR